MPNPRSAPTRSSVRGWLAPLGLAAALAVPPGAAFAAPRAPAPAAPPAQDAGWCADEEEMAFLELVNGYRARNGLGPLRLSPTLGAAADAHSSEMAANNYFDHTMLGGVSIAENLAAHGYPGNTYTENIAAGSESAAGTLGQWQGSALHNAALLGGAYEALGIGRAYDPRSGYGWYWTGIFGGEVDAAAGLCGAAPEPMPPTPSPSPTPAPTEMPEPTATPTPSATTTPDSASSATASPAVAAAPLPQAATDEGAQAAAELNLRAGPGPGYAALGTVPSGSRLDVAGPAEAGYLPVTVDGRFGWVAAEYVASDAAPVAPAATAAPDPAPATPPSTFAAPPTADQTAAAPSAATTTAATTTSEIGLRVGPSAEETVVLLIPAGASVTLTGEANAGFLGVRYDGAVGWVDAAYLTS